MLGETKKNLIPLIHNRALDRGFSDHEKRIIISEECVTQAHD